MKDLDENVDGAVQPIVEVQSRFRDD